jgi:uncharacterized membrane protein YbaN (DUF454 family)
VEASAGSIPVRIAWLSVAGASLVLGALGVVLPLLPTTPFVLVAAYAAAKGSPRLHAWILGHRAFGPVVRDWQASGAVAPRTKRVAVATMTLSAAIVALVAPLVVAAGAGLVMAIVATWLWRRPEPGSARRGPT